MRILLTGGAGFLGSHIAWELARREHSVLCVVRPESDAARLVNAGPRISIVRGDLADPPGLHTIFKEFCPDALCHSAWNGVFNADRNDQRQKENVSQTASLVTAAAESGVRSVVGIGSQAEYGPLNRVAHESDPLAPTTLYGKAKRDAHEGSMRICAIANVRFAWMRVFSLYGPGDNPGWLIPSLIAKLLNGESLSLTRGEQLWDFLYVDDAARAVATVLDTPNASGDFNLGSGQGESLRRTIEMVREMIAPEVRLGFGELAYRPDQVMHLQADISRLVEATGWRPRVELKEGLARTIAAIRVQDMLKSGA